jgi:hypothetical protein
MLGGGGWREGRRGARWFERVEVYGGDDGEVSSVKSFGILRIQCFLVQLQAQSSLHCSKLLDLWKCYVMLSCFGLRKQAF